MKRIRFLLLASVPLDRADLARFPLGATDGNSENPGVDGNSENPGVPLTVVCVFVSNICAVISIH
jgi:hypothetical protein